MVSHLSTGFKKQEIDLLDYNQNNPSGFQSKFNYYDIMEHIHMKLKKDNKVTIFKTKDGPAVDVQINNETAWLSQNQMTDLFEKDQSVICLLYTSPSPRDQA